MPRAKVKKPKNPKYTPGMAERFSITRQEFNLTIQETAERMDFKDSYIKAVEYGNLSPNIDFIIKWHKTFRKSYAWILED